MSISRAKGLNVKTPSWHNRTNLHLLAGAPAGCSQILYATVQNLLSRAIWHLRFENPCSTASLSLAETTDLL